MKKNILSVILMTIFATTHINANTYPGFEENKKACERNDSKACYKLGGMYDYFGISYYKNIKRIPIDYNKAAEYYEKACDLGNAGGCQSLSSLYLMGNIGDFGLGVDYFKVNKYNRRACDLDSGFGCSFLGLSYFEGHGVKQNYVKANDLYYMGCKLGDSLGCYSLGMGYKEGKGVKQDYMKAKTLFGMSCDMEYENGCKEYAILNRERLKLKEHVTQDKYTLTITPTPSDARVQITNIKPRYKDEILLKKGTHKIKVFKKGYKTKRQTITLTENTSYDVTLEKQKLSTKSIITAGNLMYQN